MTKAFSTNKKQGHSGPLVSGEAPSREMQASGTVMVGHLGLQLHPWAWAVVPAYAGGFLQVRSCAVRFGQSLIQFLVQALHPPT